MQKCIILSKFQNCTNWSLPGHFSKVVKFVQFDAAISGGFSAYWSSHAIVEAQKVEIMWPIGCTENKWYCLPVQKLCSFHMCVLCFLRFSPGFYSHQQPINDHGLNLRIWWMKWMKSGDHHLGKYKILWNSRIFATKLSCLTGFS